jgi:membrane-anchored protein YejM (alkaline phosphatase superfamily)
MHFIFNYVISILLLTILRLAFLLVNYNGIWNKEALYSFIKGFRFDNLIVCYTLLIPVIIGLFAAVLKIDSKKIIKFQGIIFSTLMPIILILSIADIPYFQYFKNRITESAFQWMDQPTIVFDMIISNKTNLLFLAIALMLSAFMCIYIYRKTVHFGRKLVLNFRNNIVFHLSLLIFCLIGMRGNRLHPLRASDAIYCDDPTLNQAGLNTPFTLMKSYSNKVRLMDEKEAYTTTKSILNIENKSSEISISRIVDYKDSIAKPNVVFVLMEGMSADYLGIMGNKERLTPNLDSLARNSLFFTNAYSAGIHTNNGIF